MTQMSDKCLLCKYWKTQISGQTQIIWVFWDLWADQEEDTPLYRWHGILSLKAGLQPFPWSDLRKSLSWTSLWWNTFKILLLNCWSLTITRHLAMIPIVQKLVWWSFEIRPTPHKTKHEIWNQKYENVIFVTASWCIMWMNCGKFSSPPFRQCFLPVFFNEDFSKSKLWNLVKIVKFIQHFEIWGSGIQ